MHLLGSSSVPHSNGVVITSSYFSEPEVKVTRYAETLSKKSLLFNLRVNSLSNSSYFSM